MKDFVRDFEMLCSTGASPEGHLLVWQALADMCRFVCEDYWKGIELDFGVIKPSPEASEAAARCFIADDEYAHLVEYEDGKRVCAAALGGDPEEWSDLGRWYELAAEFCCDKLPPARDIKDALRDFCWITSASSETPFSYRSQHACTTPEPSCRVREVLSGLRCIAEAVPSSAGDSNPSPEAFSSAAVSAMRGIANLIASGACQSAYVTGAWLYHILRLRCEWQIADILGGQSPR